MDKALLFVAAEDGEEVALTVLDQTTFGGVDYLLVTDGDLDSDEEASCFIMKDVASADDAESLYEMVEDDRELEAVAILFADTLKDAGIDLIS